ncbi:hypothetical protein P8452_19250 [Trifolium repens]|nr:hypothetical protein P8452_19250 [Trifolium repens]
MEQTIFVTMSPEERKNYRETLQSARELFLDPGSSSLELIAGFFIATSSCSLPWNFSRLNFDLNFDAVESLFRMRNHNERCPGCAGDVNILLACNHAYCCSCLYTWHRVERFPDHPICPQCLWIELCDFTVPSSKFLVVLDRVDRLLMGYKSSKIIILYQDNEHIRDYLSSALKGLDIPFFCYGDESNANFIRMFLQSATRTILLPIGALNDEIFFFPPNSQLLITSGVKRDEKNFILSRIQTSGEEDTLGSTFFISRNSIEEVIMNCDTEYSIDLIYGMLTVASFLPDN